MEHKPDVTLISYGMGVFYMDSLESHYMICVNCSKVTEHKELDGFIYYMCEHCGVNVFDVQTNGSV
jgi:DNA-directed RNA polymerase subunit RPC12/RpoP